MMRAGWDRLVFRYCRGRFRSELEGSARAGSCSSRVTYARFRTSSLTSSATASGRDGQRTHKTSRCFAVSASAQRFGAEVYAGGNPGFGPSENGPMCQWLTSLGSSIHSCGRGLCITVDSGGRLWVNPSIRQSDNRGLDDAEVQTLYGSQGQDRPRSRTTISRTSRVVRTMEDRHTRLVRLMGAQRRESLTLGSMRGRR